MKQWKTVVVTMIIALLVAMLVIVVWNNRETKAIKSQIAQYELVKQQQQLVLDILKIRYETAVVQKALRPPPVTKPKVE